MFKNFKKNILAGALAVVPIVLVYLIVRFLYVSVDSTIMNILDDLIGFRIPGLGIMIVLAILYLLGVFAGNIAGRWFFGRIEWLSQKIPIIKTTYQVGKQISSSLSLPEKQAFQKAVLVNYLKNDIYTIGFITGTLTITESSRKLFKVFIPTPPNPMSGTMVLVPQDQVIDPGWSIDDAVKTVISAGIIGPDHVRLDHLNKTPDRYVEIKKQEV